MATFLPIPKDVTTLRHLLQTETETMESNCVVMIPRLMSKLRHASVVGDDEAKVPFVPLEEVDTFLDAILLAHADRLLNQDRSMDMATKAQCIEDPLPFVSRDVFFDQVKPKNSTQELCGYLFQRDDIAFNCKTCGFDETCVLCVKCFQNGNHEGHDVLFHRTSPGGVCDCGDSEAWAPEGFCVDHGQTQDSVAADSKSAISDLLPKEIVQVADALFTWIVNFCVEMAKKSMQVFDAEFVDEQGRQKLDELWLELQERGVSLEDGQLMERLFHVRIGNDDVHSDEDLIVSLSQKHILRADDLVRAIDSNGSEIVAQNLMLRDALTLMQALQNEGWHVSVVQDNFVHEENVLLRIIRWVKTICSLSKELHVLFCEKLFAVDEQGKEPIEVMFLSHPYFRKDIALELYELYLKLQGDKGPKLQLSVVFYKVYTRLMGKYFCGIGTRKESLFQYGVQIFTTPSIVHHLASMGLLDMLLDTIHTAFEIVQALTLTPHQHQYTSHTLDCDHPLLKFKRYHFLFEHLGYVLGVPAMSSALLLRCDLLEKFLTTLGRIQGLDPQVRIQDSRAHVIYESQSWLTAFDLQANVSKIITMISTGLRHHEASNTQMRNQDYEQVVANVLEGIWTQLNQAGSAAPRLPLYVPPCGRLMGLSSVEKIVKHDVSTEPVSFHNPLHCLLGRFLSESLYYSPPSSFGTASPSDTNWGAIVERSMANVLLLKETKDEKKSNGVDYKKSMLVYSILEYPLRSLVLCAQISCGLWIRNGQKMRRQVMHYTCPPWCSELRDLDLFLVQVSATIVGFPKFLTIFFDRFGLSEWLLTWNSVTVADESVDSLAREPLDSGSKDEKQVSMLEAALLQLTWITTEVPPSLDEIEQRDAVLRREVIHQLSQHSCRFSELLDQTEFVISTPAGGISARQKELHITRLKRILDEVADEQVKYSIGFAPPGDDRDDKASTGDGAMGPTVYMLKKAYFIEYDPSFYHMSCSGHEKAQLARQEALFKTWQISDPPIPLVAQVPPPHPSLRALRLIVLEEGLLGILRLILDDANAHAACDCEGTSCTTGSTRTNAMVVMRAIHIINLAVLVLERGADSTLLPQQYGAVSSDSTRRQTLALLRSGPTAYEEADTTHRGKKRLKRQSSSSDDGIMRMTNDGDQSDPSEVNDSSIVALLVALSKDMAKHDFENAKSTVSAIYWILNKLAALDCTIRVYVEDKVRSSLQNRKELVTKNAVSKSELKKINQERAIAAMMARQKEFAESFALSNEGEDEKENEDSAHFECSGDCDIVADHFHHGTPRRTYVYRPPPPPDCIICTQKKKDAPIMYIGHAQMSQVCAHARGNHPGCVDAAVMDGNQDSSSNSTAACNATPFPPQLHLSLCGHAVHLHCWQQYFESVRAQSQAILGQNRTNIAFDAQIGEFLCPLCQALSSMLVPWLPICSPLTSMEQQRDRDAMERVFQSSRDTTCILSWLSEGLPSRLESLALDGVVGRDDEDGEGVRMQQQDDISAMNHFAGSLLEIMVRFQPEMTHLAPAVSAVKKGFYSTGAQLTHLIWSSVASTIASTQLSCISLAMSSLDSNASVSKNGHEDASWRWNSARSSTGSAVAVSSFSSLSLSNILNPVAPCLKTRVAVSLPDALDLQLDQLSPKYDSKLNVILRSLRHVPLLFAKHRRGFYKSMCSPIAQNFRLALSLEQWSQALPEGPPLQVDRPVLGQDLLYLSVAICSSMLTTKADILLTIRSLCVLHMAQVLIQIAQIEAEEKTDCLEEEQNEAQRRDTTGTGNLSSEQSSERQRGLEVLMGRLAQEAGVDVVVNANKRYEEMNSTGGSHRRPAPQGRQLELLFESSCLTFMRQVTLLLRAFFRGEQDPDASWSANFVTSLRLSTKYNDMCQQIGLPHITQLLADEALVGYLLQAAQELRLRPTSADVPEVLQLRYSQHCQADSIVAELTKFDSDERMGGSLEREAVISRSNLGRILNLPLQLKPDPHLKKNSFHVARIRLVQLPPLYTDLHSAVLGKSKCKQTGKTMENPAICLVCEQVLCAGMECCRRSSDGMGACTHHAMKCGASVGLFFLVRSSSVLLVFGSRSSFFGSPYLDMFGEQDIGLRRGRPLYLNATRMKAIEALYANHQLATEVTRNRRSSDQYIRNNYY
uniref:E3 ubiquitin-protein ligase n=1 Tax=Peronospora matthiolae TaxID=2874970 RepID=A0AAV1TSY6_9STRA